MNPYDQYRNVSLTMATPGRLIVRLYDRAIQDIEGAGEAIRSGDQERTGQLIDHAQEILSELLGALDMKAGGEVASSLGGMYLYVIRRILEANRTSSVSALEEVAGRFTSPAPDMRIYDRLFGVKQRDFKLWLLGVLRDGA